MSEHDGLLLVHAHPDDECFSTGGLIARSIAEGRRVDLVVCTGGEEGEIHDPSLDADEARPRLAEIRAAELDCSVAALSRTGPGELRVHRLGFRDSGMMGSEANANPAAFWQADLEEAAARLVPIIRESCASVLVTYDSNGNYGHPDHINAHRLAVAAFMAAADHARFPEAGPPHAIAKFYEIAFSRDAWGELFGEMKERGISLPWESDEEAANGSESESQEEESFGVPDSAITTRLDVTAFVPAKRAAMACHRTQQQDFGWQLGLPDDLATRLSSTERFILTRWPTRGIPDGLREESLFEGLP
ncbi:MAG: PIG-L family deacetylase [Chloroflexota bacterium]|nr:PIG-L family deacetylase [Chloroflexota bacterium]